MRETQNFTKQFKMTLLKLNIAKVLLLLSIRNLTFCCTVINSKRNPTQIAFKLNS